MTAGEGQIFGEDIDSPRRGARGLPRVVELFEARKPKDALAIDVRRSSPRSTALVKDGGVVMGQRKLIIVRRWQRGA